MTLGPVRPGATPGANERRTRDKRLARAGYRVLRVPAELVLNDLVQAVERVRAALVG